MEEECFEISIKNVCCTCLSTDRCLSQLCRIDDGVNNLFSLLSSKSEAYEAIFIKDVTQFFICWECTALMQRFTKFRDQACIAQSKLTDIAHGKIKYSNIQSLSKLSLSQLEIDQVNGIKEEVPENFVVCGTDIITNINYESDSEDIPLAQLRDMKSETSIDSDGCDDKEMLEGCTNDYSESGKLTSYTRNTTPAVPKRIRKYDNKDIFYSKTESVNKDLGIFEIRYSKNSNTTAKRSICELKDDYSEIDYENALDAVHITSRTKKKIKNEIKNELKIKNEIKNELKIKNVSEKNEIKNELMIKNVSEVNIPILNGDIIDNNISMVSKIHANQINDCKRKENEEKNDILVSKKGLKITGDGFNKCFDIIKMDEAEMVKNIEARKLTDAYVNAMNKCESCIEIYQDCDSLLKHISEQHEPKPGTSMCNICKVYVKLEHFTAHNKEHYLKYECRICKDTLQFKANCTKNVARHLRIKHLMQETYIDERMKMLTAKTSRLFEKHKPEELKLENKLLVMIDDPKGKGFACWRCKQYFKSKNLRNKHIQKVHKEGYQCPTCGKKFPFSTTLRRHEMIHCNPLPREQCTVCGKMVRVDLVRVHARTHTSDREYSCRVCNKTFPLQIYYEHHLKYSRRHADRAALKHKCGVCGKDYRSPGELRDHYNYTHMQKTQHKCPICDKALATPRSITKHIKRTHNGVQEMRRDKICQTCGKTFKYMKTLKEHELRHTGERPLSCDMCARTFRQKACLYTHKRRVHKVACKKIVIKHTEDNIVINSEINKNND